MPTPVSSSVLQPPAAPGFARGRVGDLPAVVAERVAAAGADVALIVDSEGVIRDIAFGEEDLSREGADEWLDHPWSETVTVDSRHKIEAMLSDARRDGQSSWREVNQVTSSETSVIVRYRAVRLSRDGAVLAIGRDDRRSYEMQQRLVEAQQLVDRDYLRLRDAESLYLVLFRTSTESIVLVDVATRKVVDVNPEAERLIGEPKAQLTGGGFSRLFDAELQEQAAALLIIVQSNPGQSGSEMKLKSKGRELVASASLFRQGRGPQCLVRLTVPLDKSQRATAREHRVYEMVQGLPDACLVADDDLKIETVNAAFLDLARIATEEQVVGQSLNRFLGRADLDRNLLVEKLREHGSVRNYGTIFRNQYGDMEDVEVSAVSAVQADQDAKPFVGLIIRRLRRQAAAPGRPSADHRRSVEQLTELVGRVKLKDLVQESTDLVEKLCIEAALELTKNNRASAADILGLSRQSLYSKLHRFGLANTPTP